MRCSGGGGDGGDGDGGGGRQQQQQQLAEKEMTFVGVTSGEMWNAPTIVWIFFLIRLRRIYRWHISNELNVHSPEVFSHHTFKMHHFVWHTGWILNSHSNTIQMFFAFCFVSWNFPNRSQAQSFFFILSPKISQWILWPKQFVIELLSKKRIEKIYFKEFAHTRRFSIQKHVVLFQEVWDNWIQCSKLKRTAAAAAAQAAVAATATATATTVTSTQRAHCAVPFSTVSEKLV